MAFACCSSSVAENFEWWRLLPAEPRFIPPYVFRFLIILFSSYWQAKIRAAVDGIKDFRNPIPKLTNNNQANEYIKKLLKRTIIKILRIYILATRISWLFHITSWRLCREYRETTTTISTIQPTASNGPINRRIDGWKIHLRGRDGIIIMYPRAAECSPYTYI